MWNSPFEFCNTIGSSSIYSLCTYFIHNPLINKEVTASYSGLVAYKWFIKSVPNEKFSFDHQIPL